MIKVLLAIQEQDSINLIKSVCCYKGCMVFVADNSDKLLYFLNEEKIDIVFLDLNTLYSSAFDLIFSINDFNSERPVVLISEQISLPEEKELRKNIIFYHAVIPFNPDEIEMVIEAAINAVYTEAPENEYYAKKEIIAGNSTNKKQNKKLKQNISRNVFRIIPNFDKKIISLICGLEFKYLDNFFFFLALPLKSIDTFMTNFTRRVL